MIAEEPIKRGDEIDLLEFLRIAWSRKYLIMLITAIFALASVYFALTATEIFRAETVVVEVNGDRLGGLSSLAEQFGGFAGLAGINLRQRGSHQDYRAILNSRYLVEEFIRRNDLLAVLDPGDEEPLTLWLAVRDFRKEVLLIRHDDKEGVTKVIVDWIDPETAAAWANGLVALANEIIRARALSEAKHNIAYLNEQIDETNVVFLERVMYRLIENETQTLMLANARNEYAFKVVDPAVAPEKRNRPKRKLIVVSGTVIGFFIALILVFAYNLARRVVAERVPTGR